MPTLLLARHGQASFGAEDYDVLSERGHEQVALLAREIERQGIRPVSVTAGSLRRQRETAEPIARAAGVEIEHDAGFDEYDAADVLTGFSSSQARPDGPNAAASSDAFQDILDPALSAWIAAGAGGDAQESWAQFSERTAEGVRKAAAGLGRGQAGLVSTSGGVIAAICVQLMGLPDQAFLAFNRVSANGALTRLAIGRRGIHMISFNDHSHLVEGGRSLVTYR